MKINFWLVRFEKDSEGNRRLRLFSKRPVRTKSGWKVNVRKSIFFLDNNVVEINKDLFPEVTVHNNLIRVTLVEVDENLEKPDIWIARNYDNKLMAFSTRPMKLVSSYTAAGLSGENSFFISYRTVYLILTLFPEITFSNGPKAFKFIYVQTEKDDIRKWES